jgi:type VII secretion-associated serine protease mycosin
VLQRAVLTLAAAAALVAAGQPVAVAAAPEIPPPDAACIYNNPERVSQQLPASEASKVPWPQQRLRYEDAWRFGRGGGVLVAVVDSGVDASQQQLRGRILHGGDTTTGVVRLGGNTDCEGHGTAVAGMISAQPVRGRGLLGVAPDATVLPIRESWGIDANRQAISGSPGNLYKAIEAAVKNGAKVVNVSVTVPTNQLNRGQQFKFQQLAHYAAEKGALIVAAVGNKDQYQGQNISTYPAALAATFDNVIAVGGIGPDGKVDEDAITGPFVTVAAPDRAMPCLMAKGALIGCAGTSFATPFVTGLAALLRSRFPGISPGEIKRRIELTADHPSTDLPTPQVGYGVINPVAAMTAVLPGPGATPSPAVAASPLPPPLGPDTHARAVALAVAGAAVLVALVVAVAAAVMPLGRRRRWRPGRRPDLPADSPT